MKFTKMQGLGNDYVYVNCFEEIVENAGAVSKRISDRHTGIGSDGLILIEPSERADFKMQVFNPDGSVGEMCGNGIRCLAKYVYERGMTHKKELEIETRAGIRSLEIRTEGGRVSSVRVDMGVPILRAEQIPILSKHGEVIDEPIFINHMEYRMTGVSMGNPHAVVFVKNVKGIDIGRLGPLFEYHGRFPRRINTEFAQVMDKENIRLRVWERGVGETMACGTGACAAAAAGVLNGLTKRSVTVTLLGGKLKVSWEKNSGKMYMTGPARTVYEGEIDLKEGTNKGGEGGRGREWQKLTKTTES